MARSVRGDCLVQRARLRSAHLADALHPAPPAPAHPQRPASRSADAGAARVARPAGIVLAQIAGISRAGRPPRSDRHRRLADPADLYIDYVRTGDASEMPRVLYHNAFDILSMVTLATRLIQIFDEDRTTSLTAADLYALGKWHADHAEHDQAERYLRQAVEDLADALVRPASRPAAEPALQTTRSPRRRDRVVGSRRAAVASGLHCLPSKPASNWRNTTNGTRSICRKRWRGQNRRWPSPHPCRID